MLGAQLSPWQTTRSDPRASDPRLQTLEKDVSTTQGVAAVTPVQIDKAGTTAYFMAIATTGPAEQATADLVGTLRSSVIPAADKGTNMTAHVGGTTAGYADLASVIASKLLLQILVVIALSFVLLLLAFRTVVVPVQAAVMNLLSIGAAYGVLISIEGTEYFEARDQIPPATQLQVPQASTAPS
jgi:putative drug exporter of the RND superfamily